MPTSTLLLPLSRRKAQLSLSPFFVSSRFAASSSDPTDRFDSTFWMGDLNFRLDVSRIHADWLVSRKEYAQALRFDQLKKVRSIPFFPVFEIPSKLDI